MRKYLLPSALILFCALAGAIAQNITKSVQLSQDPTGLVGYDTNNNVYFPNHILTTTRGGAQPTAGSSTCGSTATLLGTDSAGKITPQSGTCSITFGTAYATAPACVVSTQGGATQPTYTTTATGIIMTTTVTATVYSYICLSTG